MSLFVGAHLHGQSESENNKKQHDLLIKHINLLSKTLDQKVTKRVDEAKEYRLLSKELEKRQDLNKTLNLEIAQIDSTINKSNQYLVVLDSSYAIQKALYSKSLRAEYYNKLLKRDQRNFLISGNLKTGLTKWLYTKRLNTYLTTRLNEIQKTAADIKSQLQNLSLLKQDRQDLITEQSTNLAQIEKKADKSARTLSKLQSEENRMRSIIDQQKSEQRRLRNLIGGFITNDKSAITGETVSIRQQLTEQFRGIKRQLPWPVANGVITRSFGTAKHEIVKNINTQNLGIDLLCPQNSNVSSIFRGQVIAIRDLPLYDHVILINHGDFTSAYYNIENVSVKEGENIPIGKIIGTLGNQESGALFHFELWQNQQQLNPEQWLRKR